MSYILKNMMLDVIKDAFRTKVGKFQCKQEEPKALHIRFRTKVDFNTEEGYRHLDLVIYAPANYVQVWVRNAWNVIPNDELDCDEDGETFIKSDSPGYRQGTSEWKLIGDHDSCWPSGIEAVLKDEHGEIQGFDSIEGWCHVTPVATFNLPEKN